MNKRFIWLYITVFINILGFGMIFPVLPQFEKAFGATSLDLGLLAVFFSLGQFLAAPFFGRLSDRFGRKPIIVGALGLTVFSYSMIAFSPFLWLAFLGRFLHGVASAANFPIATAYVADLSAKEDRSKYIARVSAIFAMGFIFGPVFGGIFGQWGISWVFLLAAFVTFINMVLVYIFLPESIQQKDEKLVLKEGFVNVKALYHAFRGDFGILFFLLFAWSYYISNYQVALPLFADEVLFLSSFAIGIFYSVTGIISAISQWFVLPKLTKRFGDLPVILGGMALMVIGTFLAPLSQTIYLLYGIFTISILGSSFVRPTVSAVLSKATQEGQGTTMGLAFSFESLGRIVGPLVAGFTIARFGLGFPFEATAVVLFIGLLVFWFVEMKKYPSKKINA